MAWRIDGTGWLAGWLTMLTIPVLFVLFILQYMFGDLFPRFYICCPLGLWFYLNICILSQSVSCSFCSFHSSSISFLLYLLSSWFFILLIHMYSESKYVFSYVYHLTPSKNQLHM